MLFDFDGSQVTLLIAFLSGVGTFFASCFIPLLPIYFAYLSGESASAGESEKKNILLQRTIIFSFGFFLAFVILGIMLARFAIILATYKFWLNLSGAFVTIALGFVFLGAVHWPVLTKEIRWKAPNWLKKFPNLSAFLLGSSLAWGWSPCIGPVLAVILFWAADQGTLHQAILLLLTFSIGITSPFLVFGLTLHKLSHLFKKQLGKMSHWLRIIGGTTMIGIGIWLLYHTLR
jgi:cytochrome c-type biogenesis protein